MLMNSSNVMSEGRLRAHIRRVEATEYELCTRFPERIGKDYVALANKLDELKDQERKKYVLLTVTFINNVEDEDRKNAFTKYISHGWVKPICWAFEWGESGHHSHFHMLAWKTKPKSQGIRETASTFKGVISNNSAIDWREIRARDYEQVYDYVCKSRIPKHAGHNPNDSKMQVSKYMYHEQEAIKEGSGGFSETSFLERL